MSHSIELFLPLKTQPVTPSENSDKLSGISCQLALQAPISANPSHEELMLIAGLLPELLGQFLSDSATADNKE